MTLLESGVGGMNELAPGQMLLMGFNGLFTRLDDEFHTVLACVDTMSVPDVWKKVDVIREARSLQVGTADQSIYISGRKIIPIKSNHNSQVI